MSEFKEHKNVCTYLKLQYPDVIFTSDASGIRLTIGNAKKMLSLKAKCKIPDLLILEPRGQYHGLIIEMKRTGEKLHYKNGNLKTDHLKEQHKTLVRLREKGYLAIFCIGYDEAKTLIDNYLKLTNK